MSIKYNGVLISRARQLRSNATKAENKLWYDYLSKCRYRFQRQKVIDNYIADFYCDELKLVIEVDGGQHYNERDMQYDKIRTYVLNQYGLSVVRFTNGEVLKNFDGVCQLLEKAFAAEAKTPL